MFPSVSPKQSFPALESEVLAYGKANNTFKRSIETRPEDNPYRFYDGPPFITGMPHYGSLLSSIVKDVFGRYWTMRGRRVDRTWGWDCHGLPIELVVEKKVGSKRSEVSDADFRKLCRDEAGKWMIEQRTQFRRLGVLADWENPYLTMQPTYEADEVRVLFPLADHSSR